MANQENEPNGTPIELTDKDRALVTAFFKCNGNGTRAWLLLHPDASYDSARSSAAENLAKPNIKAEIKRIWTERAMDGEEAVARMAAIARADVYPFIRIDDDGFVWFNFADEQAREHLYLIKKLKTKRERRLEGITEWEGEWVEVELHDAYQAQRDIAKINGKLTDRLDLSNKDGTLKPELPVEQTAQRVAQLLAIAEKRKDDAAKS